ncbi:hypothetical protein VB715_17990 [Crocosphaera sp. UHCC 0190]|uniref:hypothetical protein n=1 Tax=Crocosphaera sp. UHCC 0190 TaxID=3110246 RepID=UPI002B1EF46A|nr:hypothetical protein [Crocosphaera sp. UHCC 0190]MEA5511668.1 hypothetical protein [Crocosphaera sp. UHCC 0190]
MMSGLLTMTDTADYYGSALRLLEGGTFGTVASWRLLAQGVLATFLGLTQQNFQLTIALLVLICAIILRSIAFRSSKSRERVF